MPPRVSVVMPACDAEAYVAAAVRSVLRQTFPAFELIAVDDGSTDATPAILRRLAAGDERLRLVERRHNDDPLAAALNAGLRRARAPLVARMDADDVCHPERLARQVAFLNDQPAVVALGTGVLVIDPDGAPLRNDRPAADHAALEAQLLNGHGNALRHPTALMRRAALEAVGGYSEARPTSEDVHLFLRLAEEGCLANLPEALLAYRVHPRSVNHTRFAQQNRDIPAIVRDARRRRGLDEHTAPTTGDRRRHADPTYRRLLWSRQALRSGYFATALKHLRRAARRDPACLLDLPLLAESFLPRRPVRFVRNLLRA